MLLKDGKETGHTLVLNADNNWNGEFRELREYQSGQKVVYTVAEASVPEYTTKITGDSAYGFNIMNTHVPSPTPTPSPTPVIPVPSPTQPPSGPYPRTGDSSNVPFWTAMAFVSLSVLTGGLAYLNRRHRNKF